MNKITLASVEPNRYRQSPIQGDIVVRCKCAADDLLNCPIRVKMNMHSDSLIPVITDQQHRVVITTPINNHQIPIDRRSL